MSLQRLRFLHPVSYKRPTRLSLELLYRGEKKKRFRGGPNYFSLDEHVACSMIQFQFIDALKHWREWQTNFQILEME